MSRYRHALVLAVTVGALVAPAAPALADGAPDSPAAPPKPTCNLVVDPVGDTALPSSSSLDIASADVASSPTAVAGVVRLKTLDPANDLAALGGRWDLGFTVLGSRYAFSAVRDARGQLSATLTRQVGTGAAVVMAYPALTFDQSRRQVGWQVPRAAVVELPVTPAGTPFTGLNAATYVTPLDHPVDAAASAGWYPDGNPSCLRLT